MLQWCYSPLPFKHSLTGEITKYSLHSYAFSLAVGITCLPHECWCFCKIVHVPTICVLTIVYKCQQAIFRLKIWAYKSPNGGITAGKNAFLVELWCLDVMLANCYLIKTCILLVLYCIYAITHVNYSWLNFYRVWMCQKCDYWSKKSNAKG